MHENKFSAKEGKTKEDSMNTKFVKTKNVKNFITMMNNLQNRAEGVPGMGLVYGEPGLGKTQALVWWAMQNNAIFIRCTNLMSARLLLEEIVEELGEIPYNRFPDLFNQVLAQLIREPRVIIVDEIDCLAVDTKAIETLRDIHDNTNVQVVLIGMGKANRKLMRYKHLYDRISKILQFEPFSQEDISKITDELSEVQMSDCAKKLICNKTNRFRQIVKLINKAEQVAIANGLSSLDEIILKEFLNDDVANADSDISPRRNVGGKQSAK